MAGDWIKMRTALADDPAVIAIAAELGLDEHTIVGKLHSLWSWADRHTTTGNAVAINCAWIDRFVRAEGFANALINQRWLRVENDSISFPKFTRHNGKSAKRRALTAKRVAKKRSQKSNADSNAGERTKSLPEKRREEKSNTPPKSPKGELWFPVPKGTCLDVPEFASAWIDWQRFRKEKRAKLTASTATAQLADFQAWGVPRSIATIRYTITKGWTGLVEPTERNGKPQSSDVRYWEEPAK